MTHRFIATRNIYPWWGLGFVRCRYTFIVSSEEDESEVFRKLANLKAEFPEWEIRRAPNDG